MNNTIKISVDKIDSGKRLDVFLSQNMKDYTRTYLKKIIENNQVKLNGLISSVPAIKVKFNDKILINIIKSSNVICWVFKRK